MNICVFIFHILDYVVCVCAFLPYARWPGKDRVKALTLGHHTLWLMIMFAMTILYAMIDDLARSLGQNDDGKMTKSYVCLCVCIERIGIINIWKWIWWKCLSFSQVVFFYLLLGDNFDRVNGVQRGIQYIHWRRQDGDTHFTFVFIFRLFFYCLSHIFHLDFVLIMCEAIAELLV